MYGTSDTFGAMVQSVYCTIFVRGVEDAAPYEVLPADSCRGRRLCRPPRNCTVIVRAGRVARPYEWFIGGATRIKASL